MNPCCCSLRAGGIIIAAIEIGCSLVALIIFGLALTGAIIGHSGAISPDSEHYKQFEDIKNTVEENGAAIFTFLILATVNALAGVIAGIALCFGIVKRNTGLMKVWLIFRVARTLIGVALVIAPFGFSAYVINPRTSIFDGISTLISLYFMWVVYALIEETKQAIRPQPNNWHT